jgi:hypothetical protein
MTLMHAWRWLRYPRVAWDDWRRTAYLRDPKDLKGGKLWLFAIGALTAALAVWWPADVVQMPVQEYPAVVPHQRPPHPVSAYCPPGVCGR